MLKLLCLTIIILQLFTQTLSAKTEHKGSIKLKSLSNAFENPDDFDLMRKTPHFKGMHQIGPIGSMFYWGFHAKHNPDKTPLLVYFPEDGMMPEIFYGNGPFRIVKGKVEENVNSWHGLLNVVYVDTPIGQELSKASFDGMPKRPYEQAQNIVDLIFSLAFLVPSQKHRELYIGGNGEHGKVLALAVKLLSEDPICPFVFKGIFAKGGVLDPTTYPLVTAEYLEDKKLLPQAYLEYGKKMMTFCQDYTKRNIQASHYLCDGGYFYLRKPDYNEPKINLRNISALCARNIDCNDFSAVWKLMNRLDVKQFLGIDEFTIWPIENKVYKILAKSDAFRNYNSARDWLYLIKKGYKVWYYTGEYDALTPIKGFEKMLQKVGWNSLESQKPLDLGYGHMKQYKNVADIQLNDCGQWVTYEKPEYAQDMLRRFIGDENHSVENQDKSGKN